MCSCRWQQKKTKSSQTMQTPSFYCYSTIDILLFAFWSFIHFISVSSLSLPLSSLQSLTQVHFYLLTWERTWNILSDPWVREQMTQSALFTCSSAASWYPTSNNNVRNNLQQTYYKIIMCCVNIWRNIMMAKSYRSLNTNLCPPV